jgi:cytoskeleton protein RodZ
MQTLGQRLRAEREKKGLSIPELANRVRIRAQFFEAIEADKPEEFPGRFFYRSFLRQYASLLELPESEVQSELQRSMLEEQSEKAERDAAVEGFKPEVPPMPTGRINVREETRRWILRLTGLLGVLVLCSGVYFFWERWGQRLFEESWRSVTTRPAQPVAQAQPSASRPAAPQVNVPQASAPNSETAAQPAAEPSVQAPQAAVPASPNAASPNPAPTSATPPGITSPKVDAPPPGMKPLGRIELQASGTCWVSGWRDGKQFLATTLHAGEARTIEGGGVVRLQFGSSGDVAIKVDGQAIKPIGARGEPRTMEYQNGAYRLMDRVSRVEPKP